MGKAKPVKKSASPIKISTSLFLRKSRNSGGPGYAEKELPSKKSSSKGVTTKTVKSEPKTKYTGKETQKATKKASSDAKQQKPLASTGKAKVEAKSKGKKGDVKEKQKSEKTESAVKTVKKADVSTKSTASKKTASSGGNSSKEKSNEKSQSSSKAKKENEKSPSPKASPKPRAMISRSSSTSSKPDPVTTRKRSRSDSDPQQSTPSQKMNKSSTSGTNKSATTSKNSKTRSSPKSSRSSSPSTDKKVTKGKSEATKKGDGKDKSSGNVKKADKSKNSKVSVKVKKPKAKPKPKIKLRRMASLNAKAILEASFSFESPEKKQRSPAPSSTPMSAKHKNSVEGGVEVKPIVSSSSGYGNSSSKGKSDGSSQSLPLPSSKSSIKNSGERKRKSSESKVSSRRESVASSGSNNQSVETLSKKSASRRNSSTGTTSEKLDTSSQTSKAVIPKKKFKASATSTSTSTSTSDSEADFSLSKHRQHKQSRNRAIDSTSSETAATSEGDKRQDSKDVLDGVINSNRQHSHSPSPIKQKSMGCQTKDRNMTTPVAYYDSGTVYQPAGPLIEPHKTPYNSMPAGVLPETVRLPPDLKVTYQTNPPSSNVLSVSTSGSKASSSKAKHSSSTTSSSKKSNDKTGAILHKPYKSVTTSTGTGTTTQLRQIQPAFSGVGNAHGSLLPPISSTAILAHQSSQDHMASGLTLSNSSILSPTGAIGLGTGGSAPTAGMYYTAGYSPHHSPFAPCKFPIAPPEPFRGHSPYPNSFLYAPATPQPSQSYFMTPFYTPPITPGGAPVLGVNPTRPLISHHPAATAATAFYQSSSPPSAHQPSNYFVASPQVPTHHSIPNPPAPGHAGRFHPNQSSQPACPCPTESSQQNNISSSSSNNSNNNKPRRRRSASNALLPVAEAGVKESKVALSSTLSRKGGTRRNPTIETKSPKTLRVKSSSTNFVHMPQLGSVKSFSEQYSLPDDITITPISPPPVSRGSPLLNAGRISPKTKACLVSSRSSPSNAIKQRDIVHVIDPRSGASTTIAKHISNNNITVNSSGVNPGRGSSKVTPVKPNNAGQVGKLNPDLDVIVINKGISDQNWSSTSNSKAPISLPKFINSTNLSNDALFGGRRVALADNDNNRHERQVRLSPKRTSFPLSTNLVHPLPSQITVSSAISTVKPMLSNVCNRNNHNQSPNRVISPTANVVNQKSENIKKRITLNECIDGLNRKRMKMLEDQNVRIVNGIDEASNIFHTKSLSATATAARVRDLEYDLTSNSTFIKSSDAVAAASALVVNPLHISSRGFPPGLSPHKNGLKNRYTSSDISNLKLAKQKLMSTRSATANSKIRTRLSAKPTVPKGDGGHSSRGRSRLIRRRTGTSKSESDSSASRSSSVVRSLPAGTNGKLIRERDIKDKHKTPSTYYNRYPNHQPSFSGHSTVSPNVMLRTSGFATSSSSSPSPTGNIASSGFLDAPSTSLYTSDSNQTDFDYGHEERFVDTAIPTSSTSTNRYAGVSHGSMALNAMKKRAIVKPLSPSAVNGALYSMLGRFKQPKWSNGWTFEGDPFHARVYVKNDDPPVLRRCYPAMRHDGGDVIHARDCVLLKSGPRKNDLPFIAKIAALWVNPVDGEMMFSLLWYYRPEHTDMGRCREDMHDEIFASKHRDCNSVATIEDRCYVLSLNEYCRYRKKMKQLQENITDAPVVPVSSSSMLNINSAANIALAVWNSRTTNEADLSTRSPSTGKVSPEVIFFCRKVYDFRQKRMLKNPS